MAVSAGLDTATTKFKATSGWTVWETADVLINLAAGENDVKFATVGGNDGPNIDQFDVTLVKAAAKPDTTAKDTTARDTTAKDSSKTSIAKTLSMMATKTYRVSLFAWNKSIVPPNKAVLAITSSPDCKMFKSESVTAAMPEEQATAPMPFSSDAMRLSKESVVGFPMRV